ncbi:major facilitator superfamily domain-containing protein [Fennellomyces sp. T-0311]|nr:major facilitator superfamily domain-containing protein [Fennellomyces sp. T-0311]
MKNTVKLEFGITNSQYGVLQSSVSIVNTVLPVIGGIFLDAFGTTTGSLLTTFLITFGNILVAASTHNANLTTMIVGRILYGIGSGTVVIVQETILSQWFKGRSLAAVVALMMTVSRFASFAAQATVVPIANWTGWYGYGFWFSALLCVFSLVINLVYIMLMRTIVSGTCQQQKNQAMRRKKAFSWGKLLYLPHSYWLIASMEFLLGGAWGCFLHINSEMVKLRFGYDNAKAAATASIAQVLPIFLMPILGICIDRYGKRTWMMLASGLTFLASLILLGYTYMNPVVAMLLFSVSLALGPVGLVSSVPVILPLSLVGTGMGLIKSGTNIGASLFDIATGLLQDADPHKGYDGVIDFFIGIGVLSILAGLVLCILDWTIYGSLLDRSAQEAKKLEAMQGKVETSAVQQKLWANWIYGGIYLFLAALSWILFFKFVLVY